MILQEIFYICRQRLSGWRGERAECNGENDGDRNNVMAGCQSVSQSVSQLSQSCIGRDFLLSAAAAAAEYIVMLINFSRIRIIY